jgi:subtilisin family serine protease
MPFGRLNVFPLARRGIRGAGVRVAVLDTGFETELPPFAGATVAAQYDFVFNDPIVRNQAADAPGASQHGTAVWSLLAAMVPDTLVGLAPDAAYLLAKTEDIRSETPLEEDNFVAALEWADSLEADIVTASIGYLRFDDEAGYAPSDLTGDIAVTTIASDLAAQRGILVLVAAGNEGPGATSLITPADGDSVLAIGAEDSLGTVASFSSRGPTADGRLKPDLSAPGVAVWVANTGSPSGFNRLNGTSFSTPITAGAAALFLELHPTYEPMAVADALRRTADNRTTPNNARGFGRPDAHAAAVFPAGIVLIEPGTAFETVTPTFRWSAPDVPGFALPVGYRLTVTHAPAGPLVLDTTVTDTIVTLPVAFHGGVVLSWQLSGLSADSAAIVAAADSARTIPPWVTLETLDDPDGVTIRDFRPEFRWRSPGVAQPPGPFLYDVAIVRANNGEVDLLAQDLVEARFVPDVDLERNTPYRWRVTARLGAETETVDSRGTFVIADGTVPTVTQLFQNFPNPFPNPTTGLTSTCLWFDLSVEGVVGLEILDMRGHLVRRLVPAPDQGIFFRPGRYGRPETGAGRCDPRYEWDGTATNGERVPAGIYLAKLKSPAGTFFRRIVYLGGQ